MAYEWFISYRRKTGGENQARQVAEILSKYVGEDKVFYDRESIHEGNWRDQINEALQSAKHFVLLVNDASTAQDQSTNIGGYKYEIKYALESDVLKDAISIIVYNNECYNQIIKEYPVLSNAQKITFNGEYNFAFEERLCKHFGFNFQPQTSAQRVIYNINFPQNLIPRADMQQKLRNKFNSHNCVVVSGIGGSGKTSLAYLYAKEQNFDNNAWVTVNGKIEDAFVDKMAGLLFSTEDYNNFVHIPDQQAKLDIVKKQMSGISGRNLIVFDINTNNEEIKQEIETELYNYLPAGDWKTLVLTRTHPENDSVFVRVEMDKMTESDAKNLFTNNWKRKQISFTDEQLAGIVKELYNHPLLIEQTAIVFSKSHEKTSAEIIEKIKSNSKVKNKVSEQYLKNLASQDKEQQKIYTYLINLCNIETLSTEEIAFLAVYVTWPDEPIDYDVIETLMPNIIATPIVRELAKNSNDEKMEQWATELTEKKARHFINYLYENPINEKEKQLFKEIIDKINDDDSNVILDFLVEKGILSRNDADQYSIHSLMADVLREQIDIKSFDYTEYFEHIRNVLNDAEKSFVIHKYSKCIASSFINYGICKNVDLFRGFLLQLCNVSDPILYNQPELEYSCVLKKMEGIAVSKELANLYNAEARIETYQNKLSDAKKHYEKALEIMDSLIENEDNLLLKGAILNNLAMLEVDLDDFDSAKKHYEKSLVIKRKLPETPYNLDSLSSSHNNLAMLENKLDNFKSAQQHYEKALAISRKLPEIPDYLHSLAGYLVNFAMLEEENLGNLDSAKKHYEEALEIRRKKIPETPDNVNNIANTLLGLGRIAVKLDDFNTAKKYWVEALEKYRQINNEDDISVLVKLLIMLELAPDKLKDYL